ncbi:MAG: aminoglycoside phosphotransferase family protein [Hyphomicrobiales bacterium]
MFSEYLARWGLTPDGEAITSHSSRLLPVRQNGVAAMLKIALIDEEKSGGVLMSWWNGDGAARVLAGDGDAVLLERAEGRRSLAELARGGGDDEASRIICAVVARLHAPRDCQPPVLSPLSHWFQELEHAATGHGGILIQAAASARELFRAPREVVVLHGDIHHGNVLDFGRRGWLAIDPKGVVGERGFDYANLFCNPDPAAASAPGRLARQATVVAEASGLERGRLLQWVLAYAGLSAAWFLEDGETPESRFAVAEAAAVELKNCRLG